MENTDIEFRIYAKYGDLTHLAVSKCISVATKNSRIFN